MRCFFVSIMEVFLQSFVFGVISNQLGAIIGFWSKIKSKDGTNKIVSFTAGITTAIICFELLMESFNVGNKYLVVFYILIGIFFIKLIDIVIDKTQGIKNGKESLVIVSAMSAHNITEGLAIGSAFGISSKLGMSFLVAIMLHNIPEGMIIGISSKKDGRKLKSVLTACNIIGVFLGVGAIIGKSIGDISMEYIMPCLSISAGAMLYIVACELIPGMYTKKNNNKIGIFYTIGFLIGCIMCNG